MKGENPNKDDLHPQHQNDVNVLPTSETETQDCDKSFVKRDIVEFILKLYREQSIQSDGFVPKNTVRKEFNTFVAMSNKNFPHLNIGTLLRENKFLHNTPRGSKDYCISMTSIFEFHKNLKLTDRLPASEMDVKPSEIDDKLTGSKNEYCVDANEFSEMDMPEFELPVKDLCKTDIQKEKIAEFVLKLYHDLHLQTNGFIAKKTVCREFNNFIKANNIREIFSIQDIGTLLHENKCLNNTRRVCLDFRFSFKRIFEIRNEKLKHLDEIQCKHSGNINSLEIEDKPVEASIEVSADAEEFPLVFQGGCTQQIDTNFTLINLGCFICQTNFKTQSNLEDHIIGHGFESDFEFVTTLKRKNKIFNINYRLCSRSHYFHFTITTKKRDVIIEKIIIVQTRSMQFVKNDLVPYEIASDGIDSFLVDSHLFTIGVEQPIVVIYRYKSDRTIRFVEQHHFLRIEEFPQVHFSFRACRLSNKKLMKIKFKLGDYYPTSKVKVAQLDNFSDESLSNVSEHLRIYLQEKKLTEQNICEVLKTELEIEDLEIQKDYLPLHQKAVQIKRFGREYSVKLKNLPKNMFLENILSPLDEIILTSIDTKIKDGNLNQKCKNKQGKTFFAMVERVYYDTVCFKYNDATIDENEKYDINLWPSRLPLKYQFRALELLNSNLKMKHYLFPVDGNFRKCLTNEKLNLFNSSIEANIEQLQAVRAIAVGPDISAPYVIFGPPGTGKTSTIVESVLQLWQRRPDTRVLITAGANSACDEVAIRLCRVLHEIQPGNANILRIFAKSNEKRLDSIEDILLEASNFYSAHFYPSVESIREYRIIVCTLSVVGKLVSAAIGSDFFTHIFVDECAASTEPEALVAWMGTSSLNTRLILSGDHKQLGPILKSNRSAGLGLEVSIMERLLNSKCYEVDQDGNYDRSIQTRLIRNYRSHPEIVRLYNSLYYNSELKAVANKDDTFWSLQWHMLPNNNHPVIFHSVYGRCGKNDRSKSLCNEQEINAVMDYVKDLMYFGMKGRKIEETDIGIISPYKKQYTRIQEELSHRRWNKIEVGAVETFQGKEKPIIIVSTVRSFTKSLGFLENPRRLNVILSRAKALLIMIGNPKTLSQNKDFKFIIDDCARNNCIRGGGASNVLVKDETNNILLAGSVETNINLYDLHSRPKSSENKSLSTKHNSKPRKHQLKNKKKKNVFVENITKINFETVSPIRSNISSTLKTVENNPKYVNLYLTSENMSLCRSKESKASLNNCVTEKKLQYKPTIHETSLKEHVLRNQNAIVNGISKPNATVFPRRNVRKEFITSPSNISQIADSEGHEVDIMCGQHYLPSYHSNSVDENVKNISKNKKYFIS